MSLRAPIRTAPRRGHVLTSGPAVEPVTEVELRAFLRETSAGLPGTEAADFITEARQYVEEMTGLALITQSWRLAFDRWPSARAEWWDGVREGSIAELYGPASASDIRLPRYPLQTVDSVTVYDEDGNSTAVTVGNVFDVDTYQKPGRLTLQRGATWPVALRASNAIEIVYTSGYGNSADDVPAALRGAIKRMAGRLYTDRGDCASAALATGLDNLLTAYRVREI